MDQAAGTVGEGRTLAARLRAFLSRKLLRRPEIRLWELLLALGSGLLLALAYVGPMTPEMAFVAPAVFLYVISRERVTPGAAGFLGFIFGLAFTGPGLAWVGAVTWAGWAGVVLLFGATFAAPAAAISFITRNLKVPVAAVAPFAWVTIEYVRGWMFTGFPWLFLGHALSDRLVLIQIADLGGAYLVTFLAALVASAAVDLGRQWACGRGRLGGLSRWGAGWASTAAALTAVDDLMRRGIWRTRVPLALVYSKRNGRAVGAVGGAVGQPPPLGRVVTPHFRG